MLDQSRTRTGISAQSDSLTISNMHEKGTWVWAMGIIIQDNEITMSCEKSEMAQSLCPATSDRNDICFMGGTVEVRLQSYCGSISRLLPAKRTGPEEGHVQASQFLSLLTLARSTATRSSA